MVLGVVLPVAVGPTKAFAATITIDGAAKSHQSTPSSTITSKPLTTTQPGDLLIAFLTSDGPSAGSSQSYTSVTGGGLTWALRERTNAQPGTAEIWQAVAPTPLSNVTVTGTRQTGSYLGSIVVVAFTGATTTTNNAVGGRSAPTGAASASLRATANGSWVWGVGDDYSRAASRTVGAGQTLYDKDLSPAGDTYWVQRQTTAGNTAGKTVTINDTAPTNDMWNLSIIEIVPVDNLSPTTPKNLVATASGSNQVDLSWTASKDDVGVSGYKVFRDGTQIGTTSATTYTDTTVSPSTSYTYTVEAFDVGNNVSGQSTPATVTTPAGSPISNLRASSITQTAAIIGWITDTPSSSQINYGLTSAYGSSTALDSSLVTSHAQTIPDLTAGQTYHYQVVSTDALDNTSTSPDATFTTLAANVTLPDMKIKVPTNLISIGTVNGTRQLQFTHITWDGGAGPFEIVPQYDATTGTASFKQAIYKSSAPGVWSYDISVRVSAPGVFHSPSDYEFPLTKFTLNTVNPDGSIGPVVATSPKTDYCITGDAYVGGVPNTPNQTFIPQANCTDPTKPLGWSVGWGDQYDETDSGQPISLTDVPDGTYILRAIVDPDHALTESDNTDNVTDTELTISGSTVTVLSQTHPQTVPPIVTITSPQKKATLSGTATLTAGVSATAPSTVSSVQFLLDNEPLGNPITTAPYTYSWTIGSTPAGKHHISARVTDSAGIVGTAAALTVNVLAAAQGSDAMAPSVHIVNPIPGQIESGIVPLAAIAADDNAISSVEYLLDNRPLGRPVTNPEYAMGWNTTGVANGAHTVTAVARDSGGLTTATSVNVTVQNPAPPMTCFVLQAQVSVHGSGTLITPAFHTAAGDEVLIAFVSADGPRGAGRQSATVSGSGLRWTLVKRQNAQSGDVEIWQATASRVLNSATVKSVLRSPGYHQDLTVIAMEGVAKVGDRTGASAATGAPSLTLRTTGAVSLVFTVGHDWDHAVARTLPPGSVMLHQWIDPSTGDSSWSQYTNTAIGPAGTAVAVSDRAPTRDQWNLAAVELVGGD
jgi:hypothetical protein